MDANLVCEIPDKMTFAEASTFPVAAMTAVLLLNALNLSNGSFVLVWGASSSVGFNAVQLALKHGFKPIAIASGKHEAGLKALGVADFVDYTERYVEQRVKAICGNEKLNGAVDCIGTETTFSTYAWLVGDLGDPKAERAVSTVAPAAALPEPPQDVKKFAISLAAAIDNPDIREKVVKTTLPIMVQLQTQPIRCVKGPLPPETVTNGFQTNKSGVSGEKVVIEWTE
jgi:D-arabinose 1-dehydrogenase-like Zn-dependent alcohol dehydrogenase